MEDQLKKAILQDKLTRDTVDAQFCSDWLKDQIRAMFDRIEFLEDTRTPIPWTSERQKELETFNVGLAEEARQLREQLLDALPIVMAARRVHEFGESDDFLELEAALKVYDAKEYAG